MSDETHPTMGELLYEYTPMVTQVVEYGASFEAIASRQSPPPAEGARVDVYFEGPVTGAKLSGSVKGVDYLKLRADGRFELDIYAEITTEDGKKIALRAYLAELVRGGALRPPGRLDGGKTSEVTACCPPHRGRPHDDALYRDAY